MDNEPEQEQRKCLLNGCPNVEHVKEYIEGSEKVLNKRVDDMRKVFLTITVVVLTFYGTYSLWAADRKDIQKDKVTVLETEMKDHNKGWARREKLDEALLITLGNLNDFMVEQETKMNIYHPPKVNINIPIEN